MQPPDMMRARGALLGLATGDALGTTLEFTTPDPLPFSTLLPGPHRHITGGGPFALAPGQITDDTQMAACLAASLAQRRGFDAVDVARRYARWMHHAFDIGNQTARALTLVESGRPPVDAGRDVWEQSGRRAAGNGSLMRTAPIAVFFAADPVLLRRASLADSAITHFDPRCQLACAAFNAAISAAVCRRVRSVSELFAEARAELAAAEAELAATISDIAEHVARARADLERDLDLAAAADPELYGPEIHLHRHQGFVRVAFRLAFWELSHAPDFESGVIDAVNRGGDADTNGAIVGALLGAWHSRLAIPDSWVDLVLDALGDREPSPLRDIYHPRVFVQVLADL